MEALRINLDNKEKEYEEYDTMLQEKYPILKRPKFKSKFHEWDNNLSIYENWGFEGISLIWLKLLIEPMMQEIYKCYEEHGEEPGLIVEQCKEKWSALKFYFSIDKNHRQAIHGIDGIGGEGIRLYPSDDNTIASEISDIVKRYERKSLEVCCHCGSKGETRPLRWRMVLCDDCYEEQLEKIKKYEEEKKNRKPIFKKDIIDE